MNQEKEQQEETSIDFRGQLNSEDTRRHYLLSENATLTIVSLKTGQSFVSVLIGPSK